MRLRVGRTVVVALMLLAGASAARAQTAETDKHIFWVLPAFNVDDKQQTNVLTPRQKFDVWAQGAEDPIGLAFKAGQTALVNGPLK